MSEAKLRFPSRAWVEAFVAAANRHPALPGVIAGLGEDLAVVIEADPPALPEAFCVYGRQERGRLAGVRVLPDPDELWELEPAYVLRAPYRVWRGLMTGDDPVQAALGGRVKVQGDLQALIRRAAHKGAVDEVLAQVPTRFAEGG